MLLTKLEEAYSLKEAKWIEMNRVVETDCGLKRIQYWEDEPLMRWHMNWRDDLGKNTPLLANRMIRTKAGDRAIKTENGWVTLQDEVYEPYSAARCETDWGKALAAMLQKGIETQKTSDIPFVQHSFSYDHWFHKVRSNKDRQSPLMLKSLSAVKQRWMQAKQIFDKVKDSDPPVTDPIQTLAQGRNLYGRLYWVGGTNHPERGYRSFRNFLLEWLEQTDTASLERLFDSIDETFSLQGDQGYLLLAECLMPWDLFDSGHGPNREGTEMFRGKWETSRQLVLCFSGWLDKKRRKVTR